MSAGSASHARRLPHPRGEKGAAGLPLICPTETSGRAGGSAPDRVRNRRFPPANAARARNVRVYAHIYLTKPRRGIKLKFVFKEKLWILFKSKRSGRRSGRTPVFTSSTARERTRSGMSSRCFPIPPGRSCTRGIGIITDPRIHMRGSRRCRATKCSSPWASTHSGCPPRTTLSRRASTLRTAP